MILAAFEVTRNHFEYEFGTDLDEMPPVPLTAWEVLEILFPLNDIFRPQLEEIRATRYCAHYEWWADAAIEDFAAHPVAEAWHNLSPCVWRVLLERHQQMLVLAGANLSQGLPVFTVIPRGLPQRAYLPVMMLLWLHSMELPCPPKDRSKLDLPDCVSSRSLISH